METATLKEIKTLPLELKVLSEREFEGHGAVFANVDLGGDVMLPGAFKKTLAAWKTKGRLPAMLWQHQMMQPAIGKWSAIREDDRGLYVRGKLASTQRADEIHELIKMDALGGLSIGYVTKDADYNKDGVRLIKEVDLWEVSPVNQPMNQLATITGVKSLFDNVEFVRDLEATLRDVGLSHSDCRKAVSGFKALVRRDAGLPSIVPRDEVTAEETEILKAMEEMTDRYWSAAFQR